MQTEKNRNKKQLQKQKKKGWLKLREKKNKI
jgi:hypothetical protein